VQLITDHARAAKLRRGILLAGWALILPLSSLFSGEWNAWFLAVFFVVVFLLVYFALRLAEMEELLPRLLPGLAFLGAFLIIFLLSAVFSGYRAVSLAQWFIQAAYVCVFFLGGALGALDRSGRWLVRPIVAASTAVGFWALVTDLPLGGAHRLASTLGNPNALGAFLLLGLPLAIGQTVAAQGRTRALWAGCSAVLAMAFVFTFSYTAWIGLLAGAFLAVVAMPQRSKKKLVGIIGAVVVVASVIAALALLPRFFTFASPVDARHFRTSLDQRLEFNGAALRMVADQALLGFGPGSFQSVFPRYAVTFREQPKYAHNEYLQMFAEGGVFAGTLFVGFFMFVGLAIFKFIRKGGVDTVTMSVVVAVLASIVHAAIDFGWHFPAVALSLWASAGFLVGRMPNLFHVRRFPLPVVSYGLAALAFLLCLRGMTVFVATAAVDQAKLLQRRGDIAGAEVSWRRATLFDPQPSSFREIGWNAYGDRNDATWAERSQAAAQQALHWGRDDYFTWHLLGRIAYGQRDFPTAEAALVRAVELDPHFHLNFQHDLAFVWRDQGRVDEAITLLEHSLDKGEQIELSANPTLNDALAHLAVALGEFQEAEGRPDAARAAYERALRAVPEYLPAREALAAMEQRSRQQAENPL
jgi:O-antigen ligase